MSPQACTRGELVRYFSRLGTTGFGGPIALDSTGMALQDVAVAAAAAFAREATGRGLTVDLGG